MNRNINILSAALMLIITSAALAGLNAPSVDTYNTVALWHMDANLYQHWSDTIDDDDTNYDRGWIHSLVLREDAFPTSGGGGVFGEALSFDGAGDWTQTWPFEQPEQIGIDLWFYADTDSSTASHHFLTNNIGHNLYIKNTLDTLIFEIYHPVSGQTAITTSIETGKWFHIYAEFNEGNLSLTVHNENGTLYDSNSTTIAETAIRTDGGDIHVGSQGQWANYFKGKIDDVHITNPGIPAPNFMQPFVNSYNTVALWHMDDDVLEYYDPYDLFMIVDDDYYDGRGSARNLLLREDTFTTSGGRFDEALVFDGVNDWTQTWPFEQPDQMAIDLWFYADTDSDPCYHHFLTDNDSHDLYISYNTLDTLVYQVRLADSNLCSITTSVELGKWFHVHAEFNQGNMFMVVHDINGLPYDSASTVAGQTSLKVSETDDMHVGSQGQWANYFKGKIDEVHITNPAIPEPGFLQPAVDACNTIALWHMDANLYHHSADTVEDDDTNYDRGFYRDLRMNAGNTLTSGDGGKFDEAMVFDGIDDWTNTWDFIHPDQIAIDLWFYADTDIGTATNHFLTMGINHYLYLYRWGGAVKFHVFLEDDSQVSIQVPYELGKWFHVYAEFLEGNMTLTIHDENGAVYASSSTTTALTSLRTLTVGSAMYVGCYNGAANLFKGKIDEVHITNPFEAEVVCGDWGYLKADINQDCHVNTEDLAIMVSEWLDCTIFGDPDCQDLF